jgi:hypothetical protein
MIYINLEGLIFLDYFEIGVEWGDQEKWSEAFFEYISYNVLPLINKIKPYVFWG